MRHTHIFVLLLVGVLTLSCSSPTKRKGTLCQADSDCGTAVCLGGQCVELATCSQTSDCKSGVCNQGYCWTDSCQTNAECPEYSDCVSGYCVRRATTTEDTSTGPDVSSEPDQSLLKDTTSELACSVDDDCTGKLGTLTVCEAASCQSGTCVKVNKPVGPCDDGDPCTEGTTCQAGVCSGGTNICQVPKLGVTPTSYDFGPIRVGETSATQTFTFSNTGPAAATGCSAPTLGGDQNGEFSIQSDSCGTNDLAANGSCTVVVVASPTSTGVKKATLTRSCTVGGTSATTENAITVTGTLPNVVLDTLTHNFGEQGVGMKSATVTFTFTNNGTADATGCSAPTLGGTNAGDFTIETDNCGTNDLTAGGGTCTVIVSGTPSTTGALTATLSRSCTVGGTVSTTENGITITGVQPTLSVAPLTHDFGTQLVGSESGTQTFTFTNDGKAAATGCSAPTLSGTNPGNFVIKTDNCGTSDLAPSGGNCTVLVAAKPTVVGVRTVTLSRTCSAGGTTSTTANEITVTGIAPNFKVAPLAHDFGNQLVNTKTTTLMVTFSNTGTADVTGCSAPQLSGTNSGAFSIEKDNCGTADLEALTGKCTVIIAATPTALKTFIATLSRTCTQGGTATTKANGLTVTGVAPAFSVSPLTKDWGNVRFASKTSSQTFTFTNTGSAAATGCSAPTLSGTKPGDFTIDTDNCKTNDLPAGSSCTVVIFGVPYSLGLHSATLSRTCTVGGTASTTADGITMTGVQPLVNITPTSKDFGNTLVGTNTATQTFTFTNDGTSFTTGCQAPTLEGTNPGEFKLINDTCGTTNLNPGDSCTVDVYGTPSTTGKLSATLVRTCTSGGSKTNADAITMTGTMPNVSVSPLTKSYGNILVGSSSSTQTFTFKNDGTADATGCSAPQLGGTNSGQFKIQTDNCKTSDLASGGGTCTVIVYAAPTSTGSKKATLSRSCTVGGTVSTTANGLTVTGTTPNVSVSPLSVDFGNTLVGSNTSTQTFTFTNNGTAAATGCTAPQLGGTNSGDFTIDADNCGTANLAASGGTCTVIVYGTPSTTGSRTATLSRTCTVGGTVSTTANGIKMTGIAPSVTVAPLSYDFGSIQAGSSSSATTFTFKNDGTADATGCTAPTLGGSNPGQFKIQTDNCKTSSLTAGGGTCTVTIYAAPTSLGTKTATLSRTCTVGGTTSTTANGIKVTGSGTPSVSVSPMTHQFGPVALESGSQTQIFTFSNTGTAPATGCTAPKLEGTAPDQFQITQDNCKTNNLAANSTCTVVVQAIPSVPGWQKATLSRQCTVGGVTSTTADGLQVNKPMFIFVTSTKYDGKLGGLTGADAICKQHGLNGQVSSTLEGVSTWRALLSKSTNGIVNARSRFSWTGPMFDVYLNLITYNPSAWPWTADGQGYVGATEDGNYLDGLVWTGTTKDGLSVGAGNDCAGWTSNGQNDSGYSGVMTTVSQPYWLEYSPANCTDKTLVLYCISQ